MNDNQKIQKYPKMFYWEQMMDQNEMAEQKEKNVKAQELFNKDYSGNDEYGGIKEGDMFVLVHNKDEESPQNIKSYHILLNDEILYVQQQETEGYRGVVDSIPLVELYDAKIDNVRMGECCESIGIINSKYYGD